MNKLLLVGATLLALAGAAHAEPMNWGDGREGGPMDLTLARPLYGQGGRKCLLSLDEVPVPQPWWARRFKDTPVGQVLIPIYMCPRERNFPSCGFVRGHDPLPRSEDDCEYEYAISEVLATCRIGQMASDAATRRCADLREIVTRVNRTFCQTFEDMCPSVGVRPR